MGSTKYLMSMGELSRKDNSLCLRVKNKNTYIPIGNISEIYCLSEISLNSKLLDFLSHNKVVIHFFNYHEGYIGTFYPKNILVSGRLLISQVKAYENKRLEIAKRIILGIGNNIDDTLYHYYKHNKKEVKSTIDWIRKDFKRKLDVVKDIPSLMQIEGELWQRFYGDFKYILPEDFILNKRIKRPPDNPINALISFGNSLLYAKTVSVIYKTHLDQKISFLHEPSEGRFSLSLDISEPFKPIIVFKTIFDLVNNKKLQVTKHFEKKLNYCVLNEEGVKIFILAFEERLESVFQHVKLKRKISYKTAIKLDCYKIIKYILEDKDFNTFNIKEKF